MAETPETTLTHPAAGILTHARPHPNKGKAYICKKITYHRIPDMTPEAAPSPYPTTLYLRIAESSLCFARYESRREPLFDFSPFHVQPRSSLTVNLREAFSTERILQHPIERVQALVAGPVTPVPLPDFQEEDCETLYNYCFPSDRKRRIFYDVVPAANAVLLFGLDEATCHTLEDAFNRVHYVSCLTPVLRHFATKGSSKGGKRLFAYAHEGHISLAVFEDNRLIMTNTYRTQGATDAAYFILNMASHLAIDQEETPFYVAGESKLREAVAEELRQFAAYVYTVNPSGEFNRHIVATTPGVPYDLMAFLLDP